MDDKTVEEFARAGEVAGKAFAAFYTAFLDGFADQWGVTPIPPTPDQEAGDPCPGCWCNTCEQLEDCRNFPEMDGITPPPCAACENTQLNGGALMPTGAPPRCGAYKARNV